MANKNNKNNKVNGSKGRPLVSDEEPNSVAVLENEPEAEVVIEKAEGTKVEALKVGTSDEQMNTLRAQLTEAGVTAEEIEVIIGLRVRKADKVSVKQVNKLVEAAHSAGGQFHNDYVKLFRQWQASDKVACECEHAVAADAAAAICSGFIEETVRPFIVKGIQDGTIVVEAVDLSKKT